LPLSPALRLIGNMKETLEGRTVGVLIATGTSFAQLDQITKAVQAEGGRPLIIAQKIAPPLLVGGKAHQIDGQLAGTPSVLVDAIVLLLSSDAAQLLAADAAAVQFVRDAFSHLKAIGYTAGAQPLLDRAGVLADEGVVPIEGSGFLAAAKRRFFGREPQR
jgi:catalase